MSQPCELTSKREMQTDDESDQVLAKKQKLDESIDTVATEGVADYMPDVTPSDVAVEPVEIVEEVTEKVITEPECEVSQAADVPVEPVEVAIAAVSAEAVETPVSSVESTVNAVEVCVTAESNE